MNKKAQPKMIVRAPEKPRVFEGNTVAIQSLRMIAAPNPKDDLSDAELEQICRDPLQSSDMIRYLIDFVKKL